jgi:dTDP-4-dehydrorhamnose 3,5-epimerase
MDDWNRQPCCLAFGAIAGDLRKRARRRARMRRPPTRMIRQGLSTTTPPGGDMRFERLAIDGAALVRIEPHQDARGFFARSFCIEEFAAAGLPTQAVQASVSYNERAGTVRGMHFQWPPSQEGKLVRCVRGGLHDVLLDLRPGSATYLRHISVTLDEDNRDAVFIPAGIAHGFLTLRPRTEVLYQMTDSYAPQLAAGVRWNDPAFAISWPSLEIVISERDAGYPDFNRPQFERELERRSAVATA